jgi:hypothetical protein
MDISMPGHGRFGKRTSGHPEGPVPRSEESFMLTLARLSRVGWQTALQAGAARIMLKSDTEGELIRAQLTVRLAGEMENLWASPSPGP